MKFHRLDPPKEGITRDEMTYTPEWKYVPVIDKKGQQKMYEQTDIIQVARPTKYAEVISTIDGLGAQMKRRIKLRLTDHFATRGAPYAFKTEAEETKGSGLQAGQEGELDDEDAKIEEEGVEGGNQAKKEEPQLLEALPGEEKVVAPRERESIKAANTSKTSQGCCNMNKARKLVSGKKRRFERAGWNLDLTYITNRIIACGFPATGAAGLYRNKRADLLDFFEAHHADMLKVYNLCAEQDMWYDQHAMRKFSIGRYCFPDHNVCRLRRMFDCCLDAALFLQRMEQYVHRK